MYPSLLQRCNSFDFIKPFKSKNVKHIFELYYNFGFILFITLVLWAVFVNNQLLRFSKKFKKSLIIRKKETILKVARHNGLKIRKQCQRYTAV